MSRRNQRRPKVLVPHIRRPILRSGLRPLPPNNWSISPSPLLALDVALESTGSFFHDCSIYAIPTNTMLCFIATAVWFCTIHGRAFCRAGAARHTGVLWNLFTTACSAVLWDVGSSFQILHRAAASGPLGPFHTTAPWVKTLVASFRGQGD